MSHSNITRKRSKEDEICELNEKIRRLEDQRRHENPSAVTVGTEYRPLDFSIRSSGSQDEPNEVSFGRLNNGLIQPSSEDQNGHVRRPDPPASPTEPLRRQTDDINWQPNVSSQDSPKSLHASCTQNKERASMNTARSCDNSYNVPENDYNGIFSRRTSDTKKSYVKTKTTPQPQNGNIPANENRSYSPKNETRTSSNFHLVNVNNLPVVNLHIDSRNSNDDTLSNSATMNPVTGPIHTNHHSVKLQAAFKPALTLGGKYIYPALAKQWTPFLRKGLLENINQDLQRKYAIPGNCKLLKAPTLNEEVAAAICSYNQIKRDHYLQMEQEQLGIALSAVGAGMTLLINHGEKSKDLEDAQEHFKEASYLLADLHYKLTSTRRVLCGALAPEVKRILIDSFGKNTIADINNYIVRDDTLFGHNLAKRIEEHFNARRDRVKKSISRSEKR